MFWMLRQGASHRLNFVITPYSEDVVDILKLIYKHGLISGFQLTPSAIKIFLKWSLEGESIYQKVKTFSKPSKAYSLDYKTFIRWHLNSCAVSPICLFKTTSGYTDQFSLYKYKVGGDLLAVIN